MKKKLVDIKAEDSKLKTDISAQSTLLENANREINFNGLLEKYGPEGLYLIAEKLKDIADKNTKDALRQCNDKKPLRAKHNCKEYITWSEWGEPFCDKCGRNIRR